ncbi:glycoside hydrolase [Xylariaceae sp. FL0662B]|nr:glycoside hydrolase [Xylariaceae sp. FL0662B]
MNPKITHIIAAVIAGAVSVSAHGYVSKVVIDGTSYDGFDPSSAPYGPQPDSITWSNGARDTGFVPSSAVQNPDIICHLDATNAALSADVAAGGKVAITWKQWPNSHWGPVIDYLADCQGDCSTVDKNSLEFFKIDEKGQISLGPGSGKPGRWASNELIENGLTWTVTIPSSIKAGNYVLRHEIIALHEGLKLGKAQLYPQCINLNITGGGTQTPDGVVGTSLYSETDPGIKYNVYNDEKLSSVVYQSK